MYRVMDIARLLGVSRLTVYDHIKRLKKNLKPFIYNEKGVIYLEPEGLEFIRQSINEGQSYKEDLNGQENGQPINPEVTDLFNDLNHKFDTLQNDYIANLKQQIRRLEGELDRKNQQFENFQALLKKNQERLLELEGEVQEQKKPLLERIKWWKK